MRVSLSQSWLLHGGLAVVLALWLPLWCCCAIAGAMGAPGGGGPVEAPEPAGHCCPSEAPPQGDDEDEAACSSGGGEHREDGDCQCPGEPEQMRQPEPLMSPALGKGMSEVLLASQALRLPASMGPITLVEAGQSWPVADERALSLRPARALLADHCTFLL